MDGPVRTGDIVVCRVNGTHEFYLIGTVVSGVVGDLKLRSISTAEGRTTALRRAYEERREPRNVWLFDGAAAAYVKASMPEPSRHTEANPAEVSA